MTFMLQILEDVRDLEKRRAQLEQDSETTKKNLEQANKDLEAKEKALQAVSEYCFLFLRNGIVGQKATCCYDQGKKSVFSLKPVALFREEITDLNYSNLYEN